LRIVEREDHRVILNEICGRNSERRSTVVDPTMDAVEAFRKQLDGAGIDVLRELVKVFAKRLMAEEAEVICGAGYGERSEDRVNRRNGYRARTADTRVGAGRFPANGST
jgi:hypothetical protein